MIASLFAKDQTETLRHAKMEVECAARYSIKAAILALLSPFMIIDQAWLIAQNPVSNAYSTSAVVR